MAYTPEQIEAAVDAAAALLALPIADEHRPGVLRYFGLAAAMAELVERVPLGEHDDPAEAFTPVEPRPVPRA